MSKKRGTLSKSIPCPNCGIDHDPEWHDLYGEPGRGKSHLLDLTESPPADLEGVTMELILSDQVKDPAFSGIPAPDPGDDLENFIDEQLEPQRKADPLHPMNRKARQLDLFNESLTDDGDRHPLTRNELSERKER